MNPALTGLASTLTAAPSNSTSSTSATPSSIVSGPLGLAASAAAALLPQPLTNGASNTTTPINGMSKLSSFLNDALKLLLPAKPEAAAASLFAAAVIIGLKQGSAEAEQRRKQEDQERSVKLEAAERKAKEEDAVAKAAKDEADKQRKINEALVSRIREEQRIAFLQNRKTEHLEILPS